MKLDYSEENLRAWFQLIGEVSDSILVYTEHYSGICSPAFFWPNTVFHLSMGQGNYSSMVSSLINEMEAGKLPYIVRAVPNQPAELLAVLEKKCVRSGGWTALSINLNSTLDLPVTEAEIKAITTASDIDIWTTIVDDGLMNSQGLNHNIFKELVKDESCTFFTASVGGIPVATALSFRLKETIGIYLIATKQNYRRRGIGKAITIYALNDAINKGCTVGHIQATKLGKSVYKSVGFQEKGEIRGFIMLEK